MIFKKEMSSYLFAFLHSKQQITTKTNKNKQAEDIDQKATWIGESGSHQNWKRNILVVSNQHPNKSSKNVKWFQMPITNQLTSVVGGYVGVM